jgi:hypothetical protein
MEERMVKLEFEFLSDGSCQIMNKNGCWTWSREQVIRGREMAHICCESRNEPPCDCICCQLLVAERKWRDTRPLFILFSREESHRPRVDDEGKITSDGVMGRITADSVYLTAYAKWPKGAKRLNDLEVGECIQGVEYRLSGTRGVYDVYRVL